MDPPKDGLQKENQKKRRNSGNDAKKSTKLEKIGRSASRLHEKKEKLERRKSWKSKSRGR